MKITLFQPDDERRLFTKREVLVTGFLVASFLTLLVLVGGTPVLAGTDQKIKKPSYVPQEAYDACKGKNEGAEVIVKISRGMMKKEISAVCWQFEDEKQLLAIPVHMLEGNKSSAAKVIRRIQDEGKS